MTEQEAREAVCAAGVELVRAELVAGTWGNLSQRFGEDSMAISPSGFDYLSMKPEDVVIVELETGRARGGNPSTEKELHRAIYRSRREVQAIVHTHSQNASTVAASRREVPPVLDDLAQIVGPSLRVAEYAIPGTRAMARRVLRALSGRMAALMANHGALAVGRSMPEAVLCAKIVEKGCRVFIEAEFLGGASRIGRFEARLMHEVYLRKYSQRRLEQER